MHSGNQQFSLGARRNWSSLSLINHRYIHLAILVGDNSQFFNSKQAFISCCRMQRRRSPLPQRTMPLGVEHAVSKFEDSEKMSHIITEQQPVDSIVCCGCGGELTDREYITFNCRICDHRCHEACCRAVFGNQGTWVRYQCRCCDDEGADGIDEDVKMESFLKIACAPTFLCYHRSCGCHN